MDNRDFIPFVPRLLRSEPVKKDIEMQPAEEHMPCIIASSGPAEEHGVECTISQPPLRKAEQLEPAGQPEPTEQPDRSSCTGECALQLAAERASFRCEVREQAIHFAAIAVGRLLRHAVAFDPRVIAGFVDEALAIAQDERARVHVGESHNQFGEVVVELPSGSISATLDDRASLTVRAVADER